MKQEFRTLRARAKKLETIEVCNKILDEYMDQGYRLTLRQLYYQLVARDLIPNKTEEYNRLGGTMVDARMGGIIDWDAIEDRVRIPHLDYYADSVSEAVENTINYYKRNRQEGQSMQVEIWTEKDAVSNILKKVSQHFHVRLMVNRGYSSCSAMYRASKRMLYDPTTILYVGDHDPSGLDMLRDIKDRLIEFDVPEFEVIPVALTMDQIEEFNPPPNPAKISDPRAKWYIAQHGNISWELDALSPQSLHDVVTSAMKESIDMEQFESMLSVESEDKETLTKLIADL